MRNPRELTEAERQALWISVQSEFPDDEMMREIHFVRRTARRSTPRFHPQRAGGISEPSASSINAIAVMLSAYP